MKATATTRKNNAKRALAGVLAMTAMMTAVMPSAASITASAADTSMSVAAAAGGSTASIWNTTDKVFEYTTKGLNFVGGDAAKVGQYGQNIYKIIKSGATMDIGGLYSNGKSFLQLLGVIKTETKDPELTLEDINRNINELRGLTEYVSQELHLTQQQAYRNGLQSFDNSVNALYTYCSLVQGMYTNAAADLEALGVAQPGEDATGEELFAYNKTMIDYITAQEQAGNWKYKNFRFYMNNIETNFVETAGEVSKKQDQSPLTCYDNYINTFFNWDTQGWYARQAYRSNVEFALKTSYAQLAVYYNIGSEETKLNDGRDAHDALSQNVAKALNAMDANGAGTNPEDVGTAKNWQGTQFFTAHCFTLNMDCWSFGRYKNGRGGVSETQLKNYISRLNGRTVIEDLELAGFRRGRNGFVPEREYQGIAFEKDSNNVRLLTWDGRLTTAKKEICNYYTVIW